MIAESHPDEKEDELSHADREAIAEADEWLRHHKPIEHVQVLAEFGLTMADWDKMSSEPLDYDSSCGTSSRSE